MSRLHEARVMTKDREVFIRDGKIMEIKYMAVRTENGKIVLPSRREPESRPGLVPPVDPRDPYQYVGQPSAIPVYHPGPLRATPPNWPARPIPYPGSAEPVILDFPRHVATQASHYGEGRFPDVPAWRWPY